MMSPRFDLFKSGVSLVFTQFSQALFWLETCTLVAGRIDVGEAAG